MDALYQDPALAAFYDWDNPWPADFDWFLTLVEGSGKVLDLGCGTGIFSAALAAHGAEVVGVDPAAAMLAIARTRPEPAVWFEASAQGLDLGRQFQAVVMTGHAFQTLLTAEDRAAVLATIARHLAPGSSLTAAIQRRGSGRNGRPRPRARCGCIPTLAWSSGGMWPTRRTCRG